VVEPDEPPIVAPSVTLNQKIQLTFAKINRTLPRALMPTTPLEQAGKKAIPGKGWRGKELVSIGALIALFRATHHSPPGKAGLNATKHELTV